MKTPSGQSHTGTTRQSLPQLKKGPTKSQPTVGGRGAHSTNYPTSSLPAPKKLAGRGGEGQNARGFPRGGSGSTPKTRRTGGARRIGG